MTVRDSHRKRIVDSIAAMLKADKVTDATHIFKNPFREIAQEELPCIKIGLLTEQDDIYNNQIEYKRNAELVVVYCSQNNGDALADDLYYFAERLEKYLINADNINRLGETVDGLAQKSADFVFQKSAEMGTGGAVLKFDLTYYTQHPPELGPLERIGVEIKPTTALPDDPPLFEEVVDLPQP